MSSSDIAGVLRTNHVAWGCEDATQERRLVDLWISALG